MELRCAARSSTIRAWSLRASWRRARRVSTAWRYRLTALRILVSSLETRWIASSRAMMSSRLLDPKITSSAESPSPLTYRSRSRSEMRPCAIPRLFFAAFRCRAFERRSRSIRSSSMFA